MPVGLAEVETVQYDGTNFIGAGVHNNGTASSVIMRRGKYRRLAGATSQTWAGIDAGTRWRVVKSKSGQAVGFGLASGGSSGLIPYYRSESLATAAAITGGSGTGGTANIWATRVGDLVTLRLKITTGTTPSTANVELAAGTLPTWVLPAYEFYHPLQIADFAAGQYTVPRIFADGSIQISYRDVDTGSAASWPTSSSASTMNFQIHYTVQ